ncbi:hypothetical protein [Leptotrichia sp. OH3620_COT-345]|uniref:hypothetical protein n=1 Tax=Leptotrichia sp. OH3620_COT-345 TaxID=2491048 RepID=UPI00131504B2|nr:hypothetical protein [Leptotrichia sp. OH3620_COT-345]
MDLTIQEMLQMADIMQKQTTKAMKIESSLIKKIETLSDQELKGFQVKEEYENMWNKAD